MTTAAAQLYLENSLLQENHAAELMSMLRVPYGGLVLDLGCGTGHLATILSDLVGPEGQVVAVDPDAERIKVANRENSRPNIQYSVAKLMTKHFLGKVTIWLSLLMLFTGSRTNKLSSIVSTANSLLEEVSALLHMTDLQIIHR